MESTSKEHGKRGYHLRRLAEQIHKLLPDHPVVVWWNNRKYSEMTRKREVMPIPGAEHHYAVIGADSLESAGRDARVFILSTPEYVNLIGQDAGPRRKALAKALVAAHQK